MAWPHLILTHSHLWALQDGHGCPFFLRAQPWVMQVAVLGTCMVVRQSTFLATVGELQSSLCTLCVPNGFSHIDPCICSREWFKQRLKAFEPILGEFPFGLMCPGDTEPLNAKLDSWTPWQEEVSVCGRFGAQPRR